VALVYGYNTESPIVIDFDSDYTQLTNEQVYGTAGAQNVSAAQNATVASNIDSSVKARLAAARERLKQQTKDDTSAA
jgi:hypothetical protein